MFRLTFHLPYYVWRPWQKSLPDHRRNRNGVPLRHSQDVSFLTLGTDGTPGFLHEAQISCTVAGSDDWRWVAYCFAEAYFDLVDKGKETALEYHEDSLHEIGMQSDPFTYGTTSTDHSSQNPREYFLRTFRHRLTQVQREWQGVVDKLGESIRRHGQVCSHFLTSVREARSHSQLLNFEVIRETKIAMSNMKEAYSRVLSKDNMHNMHLVPTFGGFIIL